MMMIKAKTRCIAISTLATRVRGVAVKEVTMLGDTASPYTAYPAIAIGKYRRRIAENISVYKHV